MTTLDRNTLNRKAPAHVIMAYVFNGDGIGAPGRIILQMKDIGVINHPLDREYVVHWQNRQDGGCCHGGYHTKLADAMADFAERCQKEQRYADNRGDIPHLETYDSLAMVTTA